MSKQYENTIVGLRNKDSGKLAAVYPGSVSGTTKEIQDKVSFWYYQQSCYAEHELESLYVDALTESEIKALNKTK